MDEFTGIELARTVLGLKNLLAAHKRLVPRMVTPLRAEIDTSTIQDRHTIDSSFNHADSKPLARTNVLIQPDQHLEGLPQDPASAMKAMAEMVERCTRCELARTRHHTVFGEGALNPKVMFIGEGPGADEDLKGRPFVGAAGQLLDKIIAAMKIDRYKDCYIANVVKCRPPNNVTPTEQWKNACRGYLERQIRYVNPRFIIALGATAASELVGPNRGVGSLRGRVLAWGDIPMIVTYHPAALLRNVSFKKPVWEDVQIVMRRLEEQK